MRALRNIDFLTEKVPDDVIEEITYMVKLVTFNQEAHLFKQGKTCCEIHIIVNGEVDIFINNNQMYDMHMDTLYSGCTTGSYS